MLFVHKWSWMFFHCTYNTIILWVISIGLFTICVIATESPFAHVDELSCAAQVWCSLVQFFKYVWTWASQLVASLFVEAGRCWIIIEGAVKFYRFINLKCVVLCIRWRFDQFLINGVFLLSNQGLNAINTTFHSSDGIGNFGVMLKGWWVRLKIFDGNIRSIGGLVLISVGISNGRAEIMIRLTHLWLSI